MTMNRVPSSVLFVLTLLVLGACASTPKAHRYDYWLSEYREPFAVEIHQEVISACHLDSARTYFAYGSAALDDDDKRLLGEIAQCLTTGRLAGRSVLVTGYTDDTGSAASNQELGMERSKSVAFELAARGVMPARIFIRSSGERLATGDTAAGRAHDRKVVLRVVERDL
jgi:outer membrane protein OmpA-like peptidoglycan-associated protein